MRVKHIQLLLVLSLIIPFVLIQCADRHPKTPELESPPSLSTAIEQAPTVAYCDLVRNAPRFNNAIVRTEAIFNKNLENSVFSDLRCKDSIIWVEFDPAYVYADEGLKNRFAELACLKQPRCNGKAQVAAVGRFEGPRESGYGQLGCCPFRFSIMRIEKAEPLRSVASQP